MQNPDGSLEELSVRADIDVWQHSFHHDWDHALTPLGAGRLADELCPNGHRLVPAGCSSVIRRVAAMVAAGTPSGTAAPARRSPTGRR